MSASGNVYALILAVRSCFRELRAFGDALHADIGITAAMRAVMEHLAERGAATVPDIARAKQVTRQNIQVLADALIAAGLAEARENPGHRRSGLVALTGRGEKTFAAMRDREGRALAKIAESLPRAGVEVATRTLAAFVRRLEAENAHLTQHERE